MANFFDLIQTMIDDGVYHDSLTRVDAQFGRRDNTYLGATYLPEMLKESNSYEETDIRFLDAPPALDNSRYSPPQMQDMSVITSTLNVSFGYTDTAGQMKPDVVDALQRVLDRDGDSVAMQAALDWFNKTLVAPHIFKNEIQRWQALIKAQVPRRGNNGYLEDVTYWRPAENVVTIPSGTLAVPTGWYDETGSYDLMEDLISAQTAMADRGFRITSMVCNRALSRVMARNPSNLRRLTGATVTVGAGNVLSAFQPAQTINLAGLNTVLAGEDLPPLTVYNSHHPYIDFSGATPRYRSRRFLDFDDGYDHLVLFCATDRDADLIFPEEERVVSLLNTLGYYGIGTVATYGSPGRQTNLDIEPRHPRVPYGESMQTGFPVIQNPDSYMVLSVARPT